MKHPLDRLINFTRIGAMTDVFPFRSTQSSGSTLDDSIMPVAINLVVISLSVADLNANSSEGTKRDCALST